MTEALVQQNQALAERPMDGNKAIMRSAGTAPALTMNELKFYGSMIHEAGLIPKTANETPRQLEARAMAKVIAGHSYGFDPILSLRLFDVINGKLQPTSECTSVLIKRSGRYNYKVVTWTVTECDLLFVGKAADGTWKSLGHSIFTIDDAKRAQYTTGANKHNWEKVPRNMLLARAITNGRRLFCADVMDPGGYFGPSGEEVTESVTAPEDLEFVTSSAPAQIEAPVAQDAPAVEAAPEPDPFQPEPATPQPPAEAVIEGEFEMVKPDHVAPEVTAEAPLDTDKGAEQAAAEAEVEISPLERKRADVQVALDTLPPNRRKDLLVGKPSVSKSSDEELGVLLALIEKEVA